MRFLILLSVFGVLKFARGLFGAAGYQTIDCSFYQSGLCFNTIANLGGNLTARYAENEAELNATCKQKKLFEGCLSNVPGTCYNRNATTDSTIKSIINFVTKLCTNKSEEQNNFLNSSACYNKYQQRRQKCENTHSTIKRDSKSLCCKSFKIQGCLKSDLNNVCPRNSTAFQNKLIDTYSSYTNYLCESYRTQCNSACTNYVSLLCILLAIKLYLVNYFH